uniref:Transmembrane protein n=1 Tax=Panagrellus redivivus TaxID=6233 RepID=A0A7E4W218_PANRE
MSHPIPRNTSKLPNKPEHEHPLSSPSRHPSPFIAAGKDALVAQQIRHETYDQLLANTTRLFACSVVVSVVFKSMSIHASIP